MKQKIIRILFFAYSYVFLTTQKVFAATSSDQGIGCGGGLGPIGDALCNLGQGDSDKVGNVFNKVVSGFIGFLTLIASLWFGLQIILSGYDWISSGGDKGKIETARNKITYSIIGLTIVVSAWVTISLIGKMLGLDILNPGSIFPNLF